MKLEFLRLFFSEDFPHFYHALKWVYHTHPKFNDVYKYLLTKGIRRSESAEISITFQFTKNAFHSIGISSPAAIQMMVAYWIGQFNQIMENSGIKMTWKLHCIKLVDERDLTLNMTNAFGQVSQIFPGLDHMMDYYNAFQFLELHELRTVSSDVTVLVRDDIGDRSSFAANGGIQWGESAIFVRQEFALQKFEIMHAIGHMVGCSHKISESEI